MGVRRIDQELCTGCRVCVDYCPMDVLRMDEHGEKAHIQYLRDCQGCFLCEKECPTGAIYCFPVRERRIPLAW